MRRLLFILLISTQVNAQWIGTRNSCSVTCMSEGNNPVSGHIMWGDKGTIGAGVTFALDGLLIVGVQASSFNGPVSKIYDTEYKFNPTYSACGVLGVQFNPLCLSARIGVSQYSKVIYGRTDGSLRRLLLGGYVTVLITDRLGLELGGDSFNGSTVGISYQF